MVVARLDRGCGREVLHKVLREMPDRLGGVARGVIGGVCVRVCVCVCVQ